MKAIIRIAAALCAGLCLAGQAGAQAWPAKAIRFVVPYPPGGGTDIVARLVAAKMSVSLGQPVVVENKPGATTIIGTENVARSAPDGYTIGLITESHVINPNFNKQLPYDSVKDFEPVTLLVTLPLMLIANPSLNVASVPDLIAAAKAKPGKINYASIGNGSPHYLAMEWFKLLAKVDMNHVPYKGVAPAVNDVLGGQVDVMFTGTSSAIQHVNAKKLAALAISTAKRQPVAPNVPAVAESPGMRDFDYQSWYGLAVPAGTPKPIVDRLQAEVAKALDQSDVKERLTGLGVVGAASTPDHFKSFLASESRKFADIIKTTGAKGE